MIGGLILLAIVVASIVLWVVMRWLPGRQRTRPQERPTAGPRKRWWQP